MSALVPVPASPLSPVDIESLAQQWASGTLAYSQWLMTMLDIQSAFLRQAERQMANFLQSCVDPRSPPPSAELLADAAPALALIEPTALQKAWTSWAQVWANALGHDASEA